MKQKFLLKLTLLLCALIVGSSAWAGDTKVDITSLGTLVWTNYSLTSGAITISTNLNNGSAPTASNVQFAQYQWKPNNIITISTSTGTLKSIQFVTNYSGMEYGPKCLSYNSSAITSSGLTFTWTAPSGINSADFSVTSECRLTEIHVTYTTGGGDSDPSISLSSYTKAYSELEVNETVTVTYYNIDNVDAEVIFYESNGTTEATYDWISASINSATRNLDCHLDANTGAFRTAYMKVHQKNSDVYSGLFTITQDAKPVATPGTQLYSGSYFQGTEIILTSYGNTIFYNITTNGDEPANPTKASTKYTAPIALGIGTIRIKAIAYDTYGNKSGLLIRDYKGVAPATLPFTFDGGRYDTRLTAGLIYSGLSSDYASAPYLNFDSKDDYLILKTIGHLPDELKFDIKGNSLSGTYAFKVQWSANGTDFTDLATYSSINSDTETKTIDISSCIGLQYIKWIYTTKANGNVALGNISVTPQTEDVTIASASGFATLYTGKALDFSSLSSELKAYTASVAGSTVTLTEVDDIPANTGVVLKGDVKTHNIPVIASSSTAQGNLTGNISAATAYNAIDGYDLYMLALNGAGKAQFTLVNAGEVAAGKAFLKLAKASGARELNVVFADAETTGIKENNRETIINNQFYDLQGREVAQPSRGLYIVNGKKVVIK